VSEPSPTAHPAGDHQSPASDQPPGVEVDAVTAWMQDRLPQLQPPLTFARIGDGRSNLTFRVTDAAGQQWIMRRPPLGKRLRGAHDMAREHRLLAALHPAGVQVPEPYGLCEDDAVTGAPFYVMELAEGRVITGLDDVAAVPLGVRAATGGALITALAGLHAVDVDAVGLGDLARHEQYAERQLKAWSRQWEASKDREIPAVERVRDLLAASLPTQRSVSVVHGDYKLENVVLGDTGDVRAILDWELCTLGDPIADLGTMLTYWTQPDDPLAWSLAGADSPTRAPSFGTRAELIEAYGNATGYNLDSVEFYEALGCWKLAVIIQGVVRRFRDTPANANIPVEKLDPVIDALAGRAEAIAVRL
jgi:aminoglycoside phosphotransferase (APT) family kinase protein